MIGAKKNPPSFERNEDEKFTKTMTTKDFKRKLNVTQKSVFNYLLQLFKKYLNIDPSENRYYVGKKWERNTTIYNIDTDTDYPFKLEALTVWLNNDFSLFLQKQIGYIIISKIVYEHECQNILCGLIIVCEKTDIDVIGEFVQPILELITDSATYGFGIENCDSSDKYGQIYANDKYNLNEY